MKLKQEYIAPQRMMWLMEQEDRQINLGTVSVLEFLLNGMLNDWSHHYMSVCG